MYQRCAVIAGKKHIESFPRKASWRTSQVLKLIHTNICGPIELEYDGNKRHFITFIDDCSRKMWVYFLFEKGIYL